MRENARDEHPTPSLWKALRPTGAALAAPPAADVLATLAQVIGREAGYRRVIILLTDRPIEPGAPDRARVARHATFGLDPQETADLSTSIEDGASVTGEHLPHSARIGSATYYLHAPHSAGLPFLPPSRRHFVRCNGWRSGDLVIAALVGAHGMIGEIILDDPTDGERPSDVATRGLDGFAAMAVVALRQADELEDLRISREWTGFLMEHAVAGLLITEQARFQYANDRVLEILGYRRAELLAMEPWWQVLHPESRDAVVASGGVPREGHARAQAVRKDGSLVWLDVLVRSFNFLGRSALIVNLLDITEQVRTETMLKEQALRDPLTRLFNRHYFEHAIRIELTRCERYRHPLTLMMSDLKGFKRINDRHGHQRGDEVLQAIASLLLTELRSCDWIVRYGGDEFLIVLPETGEQARVVAARLRQAVSAWSREHLPSCPLGIDIGWATLTPGSHTSLGDLIARADEQMYHAKKDAAPPERLPQAAPPAARRAEPSRADHAGPAHSIATDSSNR